MNDTAVAVYHNNVPPVGRMETSMTKKQAVNPYLPLNQYVPDGEPHVFGDRVYVYGSHDQEGGGDAQPADPLELFGDGVVGGDSALAGLAADGQLAQHDDEAADDRQDQIDDEEREAAGGAHLIGEAPDVAQADCRADRGHQESKIGSKAFSFFHCFSPLIFFS